MLLQIVIFFALIGPLLWSYHKQYIWIRILPYLLLRCGRGRAAWLQWLIYSPMFVSWLLLCHWLDVKQWHGLAAAMMGFAMLLGLQAMRYIEEQQKRKSE